MIPKRILDMVDRSGECWLWTGTCTGNGYGQTRFNGKKVRAHRLFYSEHSGKSLKEIGFVLHSCDNPRCVNPDHLREGTSSENANDAYERERRIRYRGELNGRSKLTESDVLSILRDDRRTREIATEYGVTMKTIQQIKARDSWAWLEEGA